MPHLRRALAALGITLVASACARAVRENPYQPVAEDGVLSNGGHTVIGREALARSDIPVLDLLRLAEILRVIRLDQRVAEHCGDHRRVPGTLGCLP